MSASCERFKNTVVLTARIEIKNDPALIVRARRALLAVKASALSAAEPGALEYRLSQVENIFNVWAKFADSQAVIAHTQTPAYWEMHTVGDSESVALETKVEFYEEL